MALIKPNILPVGSWNYSGRFADFWFYENTTTNFPIAKPSPALKLFMLPHALLSTDQTPRASAQPQDERLDFRPS